MPLGSWHTPTVERGGMGNGAWEILELRQQRVLVCSLVPPDLKVSWAWAARLRELQLPPGSDITKVSGLPFGPARNMALMHALGAGFGWLFFLDADTIPPANIVPKLMETGRDFIAGLYYQRMPPFVPAVFNKQLRQVSGPDGQPRTIIEKVGLPDFNFGEILPVDFLPTGATLISRRCIEAVRARYPRPYEWSMDIDTGGVGLSEDYDFSLKAQSVGFQAWLHTGLVCKHETTMAIATRGPEAVV